MIDIYFLIGKIERVTRCVLVKAARAVSLCSRIRKSVEVHAIESRLLQSRCLFPGPGAISIKAEGGTCRPPVSLSFNQHVVKRELTVLTQWHFSLSRPEFSIFRTIAAIRITSGMAFDELGLRKVDRRCVAKKIDTDCQTRFTFNNNEIWILMMKNDEFDSTVTKDRVVY